MKLIIDIPTEKDFIDKALWGGIDAFDTDDLVIVLDAIANGTPLDDVKAEIKSWYWQADKQALAKDPCVVDAMVDLFIRTIDNISKAESEDKE